MDKVIHYKIKEKKVYYPLIIQAIIKVFRLNKINFETFCIIENLNKKLIINKI